MQLKMKTRKFSQKTGLCLKSGNFFNIKVKTPQCLNQYQKQCLIQYQYQYILILTDFINQYQYSPKDLGNIQIKINIPQMPFLISISRSIYLDIDLDFQSISILFLYPKSISMSRSRNLYIDVEFMININIPLMPYSITIAIARHLDITVDCLININILPRLQTISISISIFFK